MSEEVHEHSHEKSDSITIKKDDMWKYSTFVLIAIVLIGGFIMFNGSGNGGSPTPSPTPSPSPSPPPAGGNVEVDISGAPFKGDADAPVTIIEFSDYQCPFCSRFYSQTLPSIEQTYINSGKVKLVYMDFPLNSIHPEAQKSAESAHCVRDQLGDEGYFEMHDLLFENQQSLSSSNYKQWARQVGADGNEFDSCLDSGKHSSTVQAGLREGSASGVQGTPAFFVNGRLISGAQPFSAFEGAIESEL